MRRLTRLTIERSALIILFAMVFAIAIRVPVDTDTWWHIRSGEHTLTHGMIYADPFSHTFAGETWINHSWGAQIVMSIIYRLLGDAGLSLFQAVLAVGGMMWLTFASQGNVYSRAFLVILGASAAAVFWSARPQMFSFFLSCMLLWVLFRLKFHGQDRLHWIPVIMFIWGQLHAGWSIGFIFMGAVLVGETFNRLTQVSTQALTWPQIRRLALAIGSSVILMAVSPYGLDNILVPLQTVNIGPLREFIQEWNSPNFQGRETWPFIASIILLIGAAWLSRAPFDWSSFFLIGGTIFLALLYGRNIAVFAVVAVPILSYFVEHGLAIRGWQLRSRSSVAPRQAFLNGLLVILVVAGVGLYAVGVMLPRTVDEAQRRFLPVGAVEYLRVNPVQGRVFNSYNWGGYLMFALPEHLVFIDGRTDLYGEFLRTYLNTALARGEWRGVLDEYNIEWTMIETNSNLDQALRAEPGWTLLYEDELAVIHQREG